MRLSALSKAVLLEGPSMKRIMLELKIAGTNFLLVTAALSFALVLFAALAGELLDFAPIAFEVVFPLYSAIAAGEWGRTRCDPCFEAIAAQSPSLFSWALRRFFAIFAAVSLFALATMLAAACIRPGLVMGEMLLLYLPTAFFFASVAALVGAASPQEHLATLMCGLLWLVALLTRSLLRLFGVEFVYPFLCFAGDQHGVWLYNKAVLAGMGLFLWTTNWFVLRRKS